MNKEASFVRSRLCKDYVELRARAVFLSGHSSANRLLFKSISEIAAALKQVHNF